MSRRPAESAYREAPADNLAKGGHIGGYAVVFLGAAGGHAEANHLVENEDDVVPAGEVAEHGQEFGSGGDHAH